MMLRERERKKKENKSNHHGHICEKSDISSRRVSGRSFGTYSRREEDCSMQVIAPEDPPVGQDMKVEDSDIDDPDPVEA